MTLNTTHQDWEEVDPSLHAMGVMGLEGDTKHVWNPKKPEEVEEARKLYTLLTSKGWKAFRLLARSTHGDPLPEFDPKAKKMVFVPEEPAAEQLDAFDPTAERVVIVPPFKGG